MWGLSGPGIEPVTPALAGGFLTTAPPGKSPKTPLMKVTSNESPHHVCVSGGREGAQGTRDGRPRSTQATVSTDTCPRIPVLSLAPPSSLG